jgi:hypothetical protein
MLARKAGAAISMRRIGRAIMASEYVPPGTIRITCTCCGLRRDIRERDGAPPKMCDECHRHQGDLPEPRLARAEAHEALFRKYLEACRTSERRAQSAREAANEKVASALDSRGLLASRIVSAARNAGRHDCSAVQLGRDPRVAEWARIYDERHQRAG